MIEKLKRPVKIGGITFREKINELVDAVNELQKDYDNVCVWVGEQKLKIPAENAQDRMIGCTTLDIPESYKNDPYEKHRRWIGKVCKFWDNLDTNYSLAILEKIIEKEPMPFEDYRGNQWYHCEPVKPDDNIIYKGE